MRIPYFSKLKTDEKRVYDNLMAEVKFKKLDCWNLKAPEGFVSEFEKELIKNTDLREND